MQQIIQAAEILDVGLHGVKMKSEQKQKLDEDIKIIRGMIKFIFLHTRLKFLLRYNTC